MSAPTIDFYQLFDFILCVLNIYSLVCVCKLIKERSSDQISAGRRNSVKIGSEFKSMIYHFKDYFMFNSNMTLFLCDRILIESLGLPMSQWWGRPLSMIRSKTINYFYNLILIKLTPGQVLFKNSYVKKLKGFHFLKLNILFDFSSSIIGFSLITCEW